MSPFWDLGNALLEEIRNLGLVYGPWLGSFPHLPQPSLWAYGVIFSQVAPQEAEGDGWAQDRSGYFSGLLGLPSGGGYWGYVCGEEGKEG